MKIPRPMLALCGTVVGQLPRVCCDHFCLFLHRLSCCFVSFTTLLDFFSHETFIVPEQLRPQTNTELKRRSSLQVFSLLLISFLLPSMDPKIVVPVRLLFFWFSSFAVRSSLSFSVDLLHGKVTSLHLISFLSALVNCSCELRLSVFCSRRTCFPSNDFLRQECDLTPPFSPYNLVIFSVLVCFMFRLCK